MAGQVQYFEIRSMDYSPRWNTVFFLNTKHDHAIGGCDTASDEDDHGATSGSDESYVSLPTADSPDGQPQLTTDTDGESSHCNVGTMDNASANNSDSWAEVQLHRMWCLLCDTTVGAGSKSMHLASKHSEAMAAPDCAVLRRGKFLSWSVLPYQSYQK